MLVHDGKIIGTGMNDTNTSMNVGDGQGALLDFAQTIIDIFLQNNDMT